MDYNPPKQYFSYHTANRTQTFWDAQAEWSQATFGSDAERGPLGALKHLEKEAKEAYEEWDKAKTTPKTEDAIKAIRDCKTEIADCLFLTMDAARRSGMTLDDLLNVAFDKLEVNKKRKWGKSTSDEPTEHVRE